MEDSGDDVICQIQVLVDKLIRVVLVPGNIDLDAKRARLIVVSLRARSLNLSLEDWRAEIQTKAEKEEQKAWQKKQQEEAEEKEEQEEENEEEEEKKKEKSCKEKHDIYYEEHKNLRL